MYNVLPLGPPPNMALLTPVRDNDKLHTERGVNCGSCAENVRELKLFCFEATFLCRLGLGVLFLPVHTNLANFQTLVSSNYLMSKTHLLSD